MNILRYVLAAFLAAAICVKNTHAQEAAQPPAATTIAAYGEVENDNDGRKLWVECKKPRLGGGCADNDAAAPAPATTIYDSAHWTGSVLIGGGNGDQAIALPGKLGSVNYNDNGIPVAAGLERYVPSSWYGNLGFSAKIQLGLSGGSSNVTVAGTKAGEASYYWLEGGGRIYLGGACKGFGGVGYRATSIDDNLSGNFASAHLTGGSGWTGEVGGRCYFNNGSFFAEGGVRNVPSIQLKVQDTTAGDARRSEGFAAVGVGW